MSAAESCAICCPTVRTDVIAFLHTPHTSSRPLQESEIWRRLYAASWLLGRAVEGSMADDELDDMTTVPLPASETEAEHRRIRSSNDRDQKLEREGKRSEEHTSEL